MAVIFDFGVQGAQMLLVLLLAPLLTGFTRKVRPASCSGEDRRSSNPIVTWCD